MGYLVYFTTVKAKTFVNSPYNQRQDSFAQSVVRGDITDRNGNVLATTEVDEDGTETRTYPYGSLFSHVIGYNDSQFGKTGLESAQNFDLLLQMHFLWKRFKMNLKEKKIRETQLLQHLMQNFSRLPMMRSERTKERLL